MALAVAQQLGSLSATAEAAAKLIPTLPFVAMVVCGLLCCGRRDATRRLAAPLVIAAIAGSFICSLVVWAGLGDLGKNASATVHYFTWISTAGSESGSGFMADFGFYIDSLTVVMLMVVTGIGTLIAIYASGYMAGDEGYPRFFAYIGLFIFAMTCLVMADNLLLLFLGWEGVGAASYLLIGYYYRKPSAVAAAKKAFIVNRVGDFGFAIGLFAIFVIFGTIQYEQILDAANGLLGFETNGLGSTAQAEARAGKYWDNGASALLLAVPFLLMMGAFGKSAQLPLHVWLPDAMEGPTPVSALIHAATMVTAGVYKIARLMPVFQLNPLALQVVAIVGGITALFAATIALCQYDIKRIWAYSTLSQLGYMFLGVGVLGTTGAIFHLYTHAFFKALLFLTAGSVMHAMAGQLDLRKMSGLRHKMPVTCWLMFIGCLALAGVPPLAGFWSKDMILADALAHPTLGFLGVIGLAVALLTAFYTFRLWFRVFWGPAKWEMGNEHHGYEVEEGHGHDDHGHHEPHEMPWLMNTPLLVLAAGAILVGMTCKGWLDASVQSSTAQVTDQALLNNLAIDDIHDYHHAHDVAHQWAMGMSFVGPLLMIVLAWYFHLFNRPLTEKLAKRFSGVVRLLHNKYYIDEFYDCLIRRPLRGVGGFLYKIGDGLIDKGAVDTLAGSSPRWFGSLAGLFQRSGYLQGYALTMLLGVIVIFLVALAWVVGS